MLTKEIPLTKGYVAIVDAEDYEKISKYKWHYITHGYAARSKRINGIRKDIMMHREILKTPAGFETDHINHNGLDNRKCNLRIATVQQNRFNVDPLPNKTSKYKGVKRQKDRTKWRASIKHSNKTISLGYFYKEEDAALAYNAAAQKLFGEFAVLNIIDRDGDET